MRARGVFVLFDLLTPQTPPNNERLINSAPVQMWAWNSKQTQFRFRNDFPSFLQWQGRESILPLNGHIYPEQTPVQSIVIETKDGWVAYGMVFTTGGVERWETRAELGSKRGSQRLWCYKQMKDGSCQTWGESLPTHRQTPLRHFSPGKHSSSLRNMHSAEF